MKSNENQRRNFLKKSSLITAGVLTAAPLVTTAHDLIPQESTDAIDNEHIYVVGPMKGYSPQVGTLLSMMNMMRYWVIGSVKNLTQKQLDFQIDEKSNSIGAMLYHLAATERAYQMSTFGEYDKDYIKTSKEWEDKWALAQNLGKNAREKIKGHDIDYYLDVLDKVRNHTKQEFAKRDDQWLMKSTPRGFEGKPTNNYARWFHVCEHESNHRGQIKLIKGRM
ncbi:hypothetical protein BKI52_00010 [marine bacterium AO1-C]|nr:hypothetical protein BKI52_00010 [marine bacterium AO1-C]